MKQIIKRNLPLNVRYICIDKKYIPLIDVFGYCCDDCGRFIANIATVKSVNGTYNIGFDCLEKLLLNNNLLDGFDIIEYENVKKWIAQIIRIAKKIKETITNNPNLNITGLAFTKEDYLTDYYPFYWLKNNEVQSRDNDYIKVKNMNFNFMIDTLRNIFPKLNIIIKNKP